MKIDLVRALNLCRVGRAQRNPPFPVTSMTGRGGGFRCALPTLRLCFMMLFTAMMTAILSGCAMQTAEVNRFIPFQVKQISDSTSIEVNLWGCLCMDSALGIKSIDVSKNDDSLQVTVYIGLVSRYKNESGNLDYTVTVPNDVNTITFGKKKSIIWIRKNNANKQPA